MLTPWVFCQNWPFSEDVNFQPKSKVNPLGFLQEFAIFRGCQFLMLTPWVFCQNWPVSEGANFCSKSDVNPLGFLPKLASFRGCQFSAKKLIPWVFWPFSEGANFCPKSDVNPLGFLPKFFRGCQFLAKPLGFFARICHFQRVPIFGQNVRLTILGFLPKLAIFRGC